MAMALVGVADSPKAPAFKQGSHPARQDKIRGYYCRRVSMGESLIFARLFLFRLCYRFE